MCIKQENSQDIFQADLGLVEMRLIEALRKRRVCSMDDHNMRLIGEWRVNQERLVEQLNGVEYKRAQVLLEIKQAKVLAEADFFQESLEILIEESYRAQQEGFEDLFQDIEGMIGFLKVKIKQEA